MKWHSNRRQDRTQQECTMVQADGVNLTRDSQSLAEAIFDSTPDMIWSVDSENFSLLTFNRSFSEYFRDHRGIQLQAGMGQEALFADEDNRSLWRGFYQRAIAEGSFGTEYTASAGTHILQLTFNRLERQGKVFGISIFGRDITERKRAEIELRRANRALRTISACNLILVRAENEADLLKQVCETLVGVGGYGMAWVGFAGHEEGKPVRPVAITGADVEYLQTAKITWADAERGQGPAGKAIRTQKPVVVRDIFADPGLALWWERCRQRGFASTIALPLKIQDQILGGLMLYAAETDAFDSQEIALLTELADDLAYGIHMLRIRAEHQRLEETQGYLASIVQSSDDAIIGKSLEGVIQSWNSGAERLYGYTAAEAIGQSILILIPPERHSEFKGFLQAIKQDKGFVHHDTVRLTKAGSRVDVSVSISPLKNASGQVIGASTVTRDITKRMRAEAALLESEERFRSLVEDATVGIYRTTPQGQILLGNPALIRMLGFQNFEELASRNLEEEGFDPGYTRSAFHARMERDGEVSGLEEAWVKLNGEAIFVRESARAIRNKTGEILWYDGFVEDITAEKRREGELQASELRYRRLFEAAHDGILILDAETGEIKDVNPFLTAILGFTEAEILGRKLWEIGPLNDVLLSKVSFAELQAKEHIRYDNLPLEARNGKRVEVEFISNVYDADNRKVIQCNIRDNTERKLAEAEHRRLVTAIEQSAEAVMITDTTGIIQYVNPAFTSITGYSRGEAMGQNPRVLKSGKQDREFYQQLWETILKGQVWHGELTNQRKNGSLYTEWMSITPVRDDVGQLTHFIATKQDVTERKTLEAQLQQAGRMEAVGRLAGGVAHDFNNLLTVINGYSEILLEKLAAEPKVGGYLKEINDAGARAAGLTRQLLAFSRRTVLAPQVLDLNAVVSNLEKMLKRLIGEDIKLHSQLYPNLGRIKADPGQIEQVVMNLAVNARDAMPMGGHLTLETANVELDEDYARTHPTIQPGPHVMLAVSDTGVGMSAQTQARIFEPFFTTKGQGKGTGLGLATVYGIVKQSEGSIWVYSEPDLGTVFKIYFPIIQESNELAELAPVQMDSASGTETILVVEDEGGVRALTRLALASSGYTVLEVEDGESALAICAKYGGQIHLLLTDVVMPNMSGPTVAEMVSALRPSIKVLFMSGYTDDVVLRHGVLSKDVPFIQKPFSPLALRKKIRELLGNRAF